MGFSCNGVFCEFSGVFWVGFSDVFFLGFFGRFLYHHLEFFAGFHHDFLLRVQWAVPLGSPTVFWKFEGGRVAIFRYFNRYVLNIISVLCMILGTNLEWIRTKVCFPRLSIYVVISHWHLVIFLPIRFSHKNVN